MTLQAKEVLVCDDGKIVCIWYVNTRDCFFFRLSGVLQTWLRRDALQIYFVYNHYFTVFVFLFCSEQA